MLLAIPIRFGNLEDRVRSRPFPSRVTLTLTGSAVGFAARLLSSVLKFPPFDELPASDSFLVRLRDYRVELSSFAFSSFLYLSSVRTVIH